jgi:hypothetical protein
MSEHPHRLTVDELRAAGMVIPYVGFADEIARFREEDCRQPPLPGGILFVGDSDIRLWHTDNGFAEDFAGLPVLNRGFGGARTWETLLYFQHLVVPSCPRLIVYCCGDNDIAKLQAQGVSSAVQGFRLFLDAVRASVPSVRRVRYLAIHPSPADEPLWGFIEQANGQLRPLCEASGLAEFVDFNPLLLDPQNQRPRPECFRPDRLHFTRAFYRQLGAFLRPGLGASKL